MDTLCLHFEWGARKGHPIWIQHRELNAESRAQCCLLPGLAVSGRLRQIERRESGGFNEPAPTGEFVVLLLANANPATIMRCLFVPQWGGKGWWIRAASAGWKVASWMSKNSGRSFCSAGVGQTLYFAGRGHPWDGLTVVASTTEVKASTCCRVSPCGATAPDPVRQ